MTLTTVTVEDAQSRLLELLERVAAGEVVLITRDGLPLATLTSELPKGVPILGRGHGSLIYMAPDFDEPIEDFDLDDDPLDRL